MHRLESSKAVTVNDDTVDICDRAQDLCNIFTRTISSLALDAAALKQLSCLQQVIKTDLLQKLEGDEENNDPNTGSYFVDAALSGLKSNVQQQSKEVSNKFCDIDAVVKELQDKVLVLQKIVGEEQRSLKELEAVKVAGINQSHVLQHMLKSCKTSQQSEDRAVQEIPKERRPKANNFRDSCAHSHLRKKEAEKHTRICIPLVTDAEMRSLSRNVRGRIHLAVVNEAVDEIENVCCEKYSLLSNRKQNGNHREQLISHRELQVEEHGDRPWVSEMDLRQSCAFFRSGESTARAILNILLALRRLKQVPAKKSGVTYVILSAGENK